MKINTNSWHYKWWRLTHTLYNSNYPATTNLCRYVQRIFWVTLGMVILGSVVALLFCFILCNIAIGAWHHPWMALAVVGGILALFATIVGIAIWLDSKSKEVVGAWVEAKTQGICPLIEFETKEPINKE